MCAFVRPKTHAGCPSRGSTAALVTLDNLLSLHGGDVSFVCLPCHLSMVLYGPTLVTTCKMTCFTTMPFCCLPPKCNLKNYVSGKGAIAFSGMQNEHNVHGGVNNPSIFLCKAL